MAEMDSIKSHVVNETLMSPSTSRQVSLISQPSRQTLNTSVEMASMPGVITDSKDVVSEAFRSTEDICNEAECFTFTAVHDPGLYQAYHTKKGEASQLESGEEVYLRLVKESKISPVKRIVTSLCGHSLELQYYGLDSQQMKPLTEALQVNKTVEEVNLKCNVLDLDAVFHLGQMLRKNTTIRKLNLQHCRIGPEEAVMLGNGLEVCEFLTDLDLSHNELGDSGIEILAVKIGYNASLKVLNLSHNNLGTSSGFYLAEALEENMCLQHLDLSWNMIGDEQGFKKFLQTTADHNESLLSLNLSWNSLGGDKAANVIKTFTSQHRTIQDLNLSYNKFENGSELTKIAKGVSASLSLRVLDLSYNGMTADGAYSLLSNLGSKASLRSLRLDNVWVKPQFHKLRQELETQTGLKVVVEGVSGGVEVTAPDMQTLFLKRAHFLGNKPQKNKKDFGWFLLRLQASKSLVPVKKAKFEKLVIEDKIKFDEGMIDEFAKRFRDENKKVDLNLMLEKYLLLFPETALPVPKEKKKQILSTDRKSSQSGSRRISKDKKETGKGSEERLRESRQSSIKKTSTTKTGSISAEDQKLSASEAKTDQTFNNSRDSGNPEKVSFNNNYKLSDNEANKDVESNDVTLKENITDYEISNEDESTNEISKVILETKEITETD